MSDDLSKYAPLKAADQPFKPIPSPQALCKVSVVPVGNLTMPGFLFCQDFVGDMYMPNFAYLCEHVPSKRRVLFDLGLRKNLAYHDTMKPFFDLWKCEAPASAQETMEAAGISLDSIDTIVFSHGHFDHIGDIRNLPKSTKLLFGNYDDPELIKDKKHLTTTFHVDEKDLEGRDIKCLKSTDKWQDIGSHKGLDFFGDGSFYLMDTPGHYNGHVGALVCIATDPEPRYFLLGGDVAHHLSLIYYDNPTAIGVYPSKYNPLSPFRESQPEKLQSFEHDLGKSYKTMAEMARMDHEDNIVVLLAHDESLDAVFSQFGSLEKVIPLDGSKEEFKKLKEREKPKFELKKGAH